MKCSSLLCCTALAMLTGCSSINSMMPNLQMPQQDHSLAVKPTSEEAKLVLMRPRNSMLALGHKQTIYVYQSTVKLGELNEGRFMTLAGDPLPKELTLHWFDSQYPSVSKTMNLTINMEAGDVQAVELQFEDEKLIAALVNQADAASSLPWLAEAKAAVNYTSTLAKRPSSKPRNLEPVIAHQE